MKIRFPYRIHVDFLVVVTFFKFGSIFLCTQSTQPRKTPKTIGNPKSPLLHPSYLVDGHILLGLAELVGDQLGLDLVPGDVELPDQDALVFGLRQVDVLLRNLREVELKGEAVLRALHLRVPFHAHVV